MSKMKILPTCKGCAERRQAIAAKLTTWRDNLHRKFNVAPLAKKKIHPSKNG